ncbi:hypothetical protein TNCV_1749101 [Trichonephila clavipes]|nr:hypothetical protein TNCV_1749101 [Trichonephila clavipes]
MVLFRFVGAGDKVTKIDTNNAKRKSIETKKVPAGVSPEVVLRERDGMAPVGGWRALTQDAGIHHVAMETGSKQRSHVLQRPTRPVSKRTIIPSIVRRGLKQQKRRVNL